MNWTLPGTTLTVPKEEVSSVERQFSTIFIGGGIVLSQVLAITGLEAYTVQNWVKRGFLPAPEHKRYNMNQLCRILIINMLKGSLPMEKVTGLIHFLNGELDDVSDDLIDDARLYFLFVKLAVKIQEEYTYTQWDALISEAVADYHEPIPGARDRVEKVLRVMLMAWSAAKLRRQAELLLEELT